MTADTRAKAAVVTVEARGRRAEFGAAELPVTLGAGSADVALEGVAGSIQIGRLNSVFFVQTGREARNLRVGGEPLAGTRELKDGDVVAFDRARLTCRIAGEQLAVRVESVVTAGDTAPPDLDELARGGSAAEVAITPIAFNPSARGTGTAARRGPSYAMLGAALGFLVFATIGWFAFTAKSVTLAIEPPPATVRLPGTFLKLKVGERFLMRPGSHWVVAELPGYYPLDTGIAVDTLADQTIALTMTKLPGLVTLSTDPEVGAQVTVDGEPLGTTPLVDAELTPGTHRLEFRAPRYLPDVRELDVQGAGERQALATTLTPDWAPVTLRTEPPGATLLVDGVAVGTTPTAVDVDSGEHELEVRLAGYNAWTGRIVVRSNQPQQLPDVKLALADGRLELASNPSEAAVSIDGEFRGRTPLALRLSPGRAHRVAVSKPGYETTTRELSVAADSGRRLVIELAAEYGEIAVASTPVGAEVWVDGERQGVTPATLNLTAVAHVIEIRQRGFAAEQSELTPRPGFPQRLERALVPLDESSGGGFKSVLNAGGAYELRLLPGGQFTMGSSRREPLRRANESLRPVRVTRAYYLGSREVTNAEFRRFRPSHDSGEFNGYSLNGDDQPAVNLTFADVVQYLNWLSIQDGLQPVYEEQIVGWVATLPLRSGYRLPTEAEWEWAARFLGQEKGLLYPWGSDMPPPDRAGNYADVTAARILPSALQTYDDGQPVSAPVGIYPADSYGIFDLGGNVAEWVQDVYVADALDSEERVDDPLGPASGRMHVIRGASWRSATVTDLRVAARSSGYEGREDLGFRVARNLQ